MSIGQAAPTTPDDAPVGVDGQALSKRGLATRRKLMVAAEATFAEEGWHDASIVKITEAAGVAQGTFYRYFASKQAIFDEVVVDLNRRVRQAMSEGAATGTTRSEKEEGGFRAFFEFTARHPALYRIIRQAEFASPPALHLHYGRIAGGYIDGLHEAMDRGDILSGDPEVIGWMLMGIGELVGMRWVLWNEEGKMPDEVFDEVMAFIRRGLGATDVGDPADAGAPGGTG